ncbi:hypothetical protein Catovirus_1_171 [Catovirus CTV1]|uniref:Uncharacterized protein n=1 Tax=Catovirus CTV1 TaxID=1977631 RepID=A0A1V0S8U6_9VIRU|nr:hypothetical protein Catovirus_1_171 [Catovirus CTV1]
MSNHTTVSLLTNFFRRKTGEKLQKTPENSRKTPEFHTLIYKKTPEKLQKNSRKTPEYPNSSYCITLSYQKSLMKIYSKIFIYFLLSKNNIKIIQLFHRIFLAKKLKNVVYMISVTKIRYITRFIIIYFFLLFIRNL